MSDVRLRRVAAAGLVGAVLGMAGTFAPSAALRGLGRHGAEERVVVEPSSAHGIWLEFRRR